MRSSLSRTKCIVEKVSGGTRTGPLKLANAHCIKDSSTHWLTDEFRKGIENVNDSEPNHQILVAANVPLGFRVDDVDEERVHQQRSTKRDIRKDFHVRDHRRHEDAQKSVWFSSAVREKSTMKACSNLTL